MGRIFWALVILGLSALLYLGLDSNSIKTNLFALLPDEQQGDLPQHAVEAYSEKLSRKVLFLLSAHDDQSAIRMAENILPRLNESGLFSLLQAKFSAQDLTAYYKSFDQYRYSMLSKKDRQGIKDSPHEWLANKFVSLLVSPVSGLDSNTLKNDPFLLYRDFIASRPGGNPNATLVKGYTIFKVGAHSHLLINTELSEGAFTQSVQDRFSLLLDEFADVSERQDTSSNSNNSQTVTVFGVIRYALDNRRLAEHEMSTIGLGSLLGIILIFLLVFRRLLLLPIILLPVGVGVLSAFSISITLFSELHLISIVFGASLIGVSIDYALHYCCHHSNLSNSNNSQNALLDVRSALTLGLLTSSIGYLTLSVADFPALRQMAAMAIAGLAGAYFTVIFWLPSLIKQPLTVPEGIVKGLTAWTDWLSRLKPIPIGAVIFLVVSLYAINFMIKNNQDDVNILRATIPELDRIELHIQSVLGETPNSQFFIVQGQTSVQVIDNERALIKRLRLEATVSERIYAMSEWFPDDVEQLDNFTLLQRAANGNESMDTRQSVTGVSSEILESYRKKIIAEKFNTFGINEFIQTPLGQLHKHLWLGKIEGHYYSIVSLYGFKDLVKLNVIAKQQGVVLIDRAASISRLLARYRDIIEKLFLLVLLAIFVLLSFRFGIKDSFRVVSAPLLAALLSFLCLNLFNGSYNLFSIFGLIITIAISIDYAVFIRESNGYHKGTYLAIALASLTTLLALGLLSLSNTPALSAFGTSLLFGVVFSLILTPLIVRPKVT